MITENWLPSSNQLPDSDDSLFVAEKLNFFEDTVEIIGVLKLNPVCFISLGCLVVFFQGRQLLFREYIC